jgi:hypothetical protein
MWSKSFAFPYWRPQALPPPHIPCTCVACRRRQSGTDSPTWYTKRSRYKWHSPAFRLSSSRGRAMWRLVVADRVRVRPNPAQSPSWDTSLHKWLALCSPCGSYRLRTIHWRLFSNATGWESQSPLRSTLAGTSKSPPRLASRIADSSP